MKNENLKPNINDIVNRNLYKFIIITTPIALLIAFIPLFLQQDAAKIYVNVTTPVIISISLILCIYALRSYKKSEFTKLGKCLAIYLSLYLAADLTWDFYEFVLQIDAPLPSVADLFWLLAYIPLCYICVSTLLFYYEYSRPRVLVMTCMLMFFVSIIILSPLIGITLASVSLSSLLETVIILIYPMLDLWIITLILLLVSIYRRGKLALYWMFILIAILFELSGDIIYCYFETYELYYTGSLPDSFFILCQFFFILGFSVIILTKRYSEHLGFEPEGKYKIKYAFLVYSNGCLITHFSAPESKMVDADIFAGMLTAVQSFVKDSFKETMDKEGREGLDNLRYKSLEIAIEQGKNVYLAVVVDGRVTDRLHERMKNIIKNVEETYFTELEKWNGTHDSMGSVMGIIRDGLHI